MSNAQQEQEVHILPHPAKSNNPTNLDPNPAMMAHQAKGPHVPHQDLLDKLDAPLSHEELKKRSEELNKES